MTRSGTRRPSRGSRPKPQPGERSRSAAWARSKLSAARRWEGFAPTISAATGWEVWNPGLYGEPWHARFRLAYPPRRRPLVVFGLNPGPYGMAQSGIPFTDLKRITERLPRLKAAIEAGGSSIPATLELPGLAPPSLQPYLTRTFESSAVRVYRFLELAWGSAEEGFRQVVVANPCTLLFMDPETKENRTPADLARVVRARGTHDARALQSEQDRLRWLAASEAILALDPRGVVLFGRDVHAALGESLATRFPALPVLPWEHPARAVPDTWSRGLIRALEDLHLLGP